MPDAKSLLPGRAFRSEHAQLRPEPHSIASHGPAPMDPLQTTRMRNGVLYAAEWPCCHDPLRLSLGSEDPFSQITRVRRARSRTLSPGCAPAARAECVRLPRARGGVRPTPQTLSLFAPREPSRRCRSTLSPTQPRLRASAVLSLFSLHAQPPGCVFPSFSSVAVRRPESYTPRSRQPTGVCASTAAPEPGRESARACPCAN